MRQTIVSSEFHRPAYMNRTAKKIIHCPHWVAICESSPTVNFPEIPSIVVKLFHAMTLSQLPFILAVFLK